jgi:4-amino-4-deoxy-L-arabinose transferase-like glycosyltransferase
MASSPSNNDLRHAIWEREMKRLGVVTRLLAAVLLALVARILIFGSTVTTGLTATVIAALTLASLLLTRYGRRHEPPPSSQPRPAGGREAASAGGCIRD